MTHYSLKTRAGHLVSYDDQSDLLVVEKLTGGSSIVIDLSNDQVRIISKGDIEFCADGVIRMKAKKGFKVETDGTAQIVAAEETIIRGKMVRIN